MHAVWPHWEAMDQMVLSQIAMALCHGDSTLISPNRLLQARRKKEQASVGSISRGMKIVTLKTNPLQTPSQVTSHKPVIVLTDPALAFVIALILWHTQTLI